MLTIGKIMRLADNKRVVGCMRRLSAGYTVKIQKNVYSREWIRYQGMTYPDPEGHDGCEGDTLVLPVGVEVWLIGEVLGGHAHHLHRRRQEQRDLHAYMQKGQERTGQGIGAGHIRQASSARSGR